MQKRLATLLILLAGLGIIFPYAVPAHAQAENIALGKIIYLQHDDTYETAWDWYGDFWSYLPGDAEPVRHTTWGHNDLPILSPDGRYVAYLSVSTFYLDLMNAGDDLALSGTPKMNVWIWDLTTGEFTRIANQPADADSADDGIHRSRPVWSPDSTKLAWVEFNFSSDEPSSPLMVYELATGATDVWYEGLSAGFQDAGFYPPNGLRWGTFLSWHYFTFGLGEDGSRGGYIIEFFAPNERVAAHEIQYIDEPGPTFQNAEWVDYNGQPMIGLQYDGSGWQILDPATGNKQALENPPQLHTASDAGMRLVPDATAGWLAVGDTAFPISDPTTRTVSAALSPDGTAIAAINAIGRGVIFDRAEGIGDLPPGGREENLIAVVWSPMVWQATGKPIQ